MWEIITFAVVKQAMSLIPFVLAGLTLGMLSGQFLEERLIKKLVIFMLIVSGVVLILQNL